VDNSKATSEFMTRLGNYTVRGKDKIIVGHIRWVWPNKQPPDG